MAPVNQRKHLGRDKFGAQFSLLKTQQYTDPVTRTVIPTMYVPIVCKKVIQAVSSRHEHLYPTLRLICSRVLTATAQSRGTHPAD